MRICINYVLFGWLCGSPSKRKPIPNWPTRFTNVAKIQNVYGQRKIRKHQNTKSNVCVVIVIKMYSVVRLRMSWNTVHCTFCIMYNMLISIIFVSLYGCFKWCVCVYVWCVLCVMSVDWNESIIQSCWLQMIKYTANWERYSLKHLCPCCEYIRINPRKERLIFFPSHFVCTHIDKHQFTLITSNDTIIS